MRIIEYLESNRISLDDKWSWRSDKSESEFYIWADNHLINEYYIDEIGVRYFYYIQNEFIAYILKAKFGDKIEICAASFDIDTKEVRYLKKSGLFDFILGRYDVFESTLNRL